MEIDDNKLIKALEELDSNLDKSLEIHGIDKGTRIGIIGRHILRFEIMTGITHWEGKDLVSLRPIEKTEVCKEIKK